MPEGSPFHVSEATHQFRSNNQIIWSLKTDLGILPAPNAYTPLLEIHSSTTSSTISAKCIPIHMVPVTVMGKIEYRFSLELAEPIYTMRQASTIPWLWILPQRQVAAAA
jgi:hypothetical protein